MQIQRYQQQSSEYYSHEVITIGLEGSYSSEIENSRKKSERF